MQLAFDHQQLTDLLARLDITEPVLPAHTLSGLAMAIASAPDIIEGEE